jgi:spore coat polysaccharide biosynthesis predicted glycosyltransferase SpsG
MSRIKIFTEAGIGIGFGHLTRCSAIWEQLSEEGEEVSLHVYLRDIDLDQPEINNLNWLDSEVEALINPEDIVLVDSYLVSNTWLKSAKDISRKLVHLDDYNRTVYPVDLIVNPNVFAQELDYSNQSAECVGGPEHVILRSAFRDPKIKVPSSGKTTILITVGGSDYRDMLPKLSKWAIESGDVKVRVVVPNEQLKIAEEATTLPLLSAEEMASEMLNADVIISACGQTLHELAALDRPVIGICLDEDQVLNHQFYNRIGFIRGNLCWNDNDLEIKVKQELRRLDSEVERTKLSAVSPTIDPYGVKNVVAAILNIHD